MSGSVVAMMAAFYALAFANIFLRSSMGVLAPELSVELRLSPEMLGAVASGYFVAYALMQIPTGLLLDRFGPRRTVICLFTVTVLGTGLFALARSGEVMLLARVLMGTGCAGVFAAAFMIISRFFAAQRFTSVGGTLNSFAMLGTLFATAPLAALVVWLGWRASFGLITGGMLAIAVLSILTIRDSPATPSPAARPRAQAPGALLSGLAEVLRTPGVLALASGGIALSAGNTILGIWGGPYLNDVHGLDEVSRGKVLAAMAAAGVCGHFLFGHAARWFNTLKGLVIASCIAITCLTGTLALLERPSVPTVTGLFALLALACSFPNILLAHARALVPTRLMGRGLTTVNTGIMLSIAGMQLAVGSVIGWRDPAAHGADPAVAYRTAFGFIAIMALVSCFIYARVQDRPPR